MKNTKKGNMNKALMMGTALISLNALAVAEAQAATDTGSVSAIILQPIAISVTQDMHFGALTATGADALVLNTAGVRDPGATLTNVTLVTGAGAEQQAIVTVAGGTGAAIDLAMGTVSAAATAFPVTHSTNAQTMQVNNFNIGSDAAGDAIVIANLTATPGPFNVGATLQVTAAQAVPANAGTYSGTFQIFASYQ